MRCVLALIEMHGFISNYIKFMKLVVKNNILCAQKEVARKKEEADKRKEELSTNEKQSKL